MSDAATISIVALPFALWALQKTAESVVRFRQTLRARYIDTVQLADDIATNIKNSRVQITTLETELSGTPCPLEGRIAADPRYFAFSVAGELTFEIFEKDAVERFSHIESDLFKKVKQFYDLQAILTATFESLQADIFRDLKPDTRKLGVFRKLLDFLKQADDIGSKCTKDLDQEIKLIENSLLWALLALNHKRFRKDDIQSGAAASSGSPEVDKGTNSV